MLERIIVGLQRTDNVGKKQLKLIARLHDDIDISEACTWKDGTALFNTSTAHLRKLLHAGDGSTHISIAKWSMHSPHSIVPDRLWERIWRPEISLKEACLAWKTLYRALATNAERWHCLPEIDTRT